MALTRAMLKGMGLTDEQVGAIIEEHTNTVDGLKADRDKYKGEAEKNKAESEKVASLEKRIKELESDTSGEEWKKKYDDEHANFEKYKSDADEKERIGNLKSAYKKLLADCKVGDKHVDSILKVTDFSSMKLDKDGNLEDADKLKESISADWSGFISTTGTKGADVDNPPGENGNPDNQKGRAAELAAKYHENLYGKGKEE